jgi:hypothetical protein
MKRLLVCILFCSAFWAHGQIVINEICATNGDLVSDPQFFNFPTWVELYNNGNSAVNIGGYYLSDDASAKMKWRIPSGTSIPSKGYLLIWCDDVNTSLHTNFNLDSDGEELILSSSSQATLDHIEFPKQHLNVSYGRTSDGGSTVAFLVDPTPGAANKPATGTIQLENPQLSLKSGRYGSSQTLTMSAPEGVMISYSLDGSEPTTASAKYSSPLTIANTTTVKAKSYRDGFLPSKTEVKTYFISEHAFTLPVISLSTRPQYLTNNTIGIYVAGTNGASGNCTEQAVNWNRDWDRHAVFEFFESSGEKVFDQHVDIRIGGACSRNNPQKSLVVKARDRFGSKIIEHKFFPTKDISEFGGLMLRNAGNDFYGTMFRDALMQTLPLGQMDIDYMAYQPAIVYINGAYWGIQNIREKIDADYIESNFGVSKDDLDLIETGGNALEGTAAHYEMYMDSLAKIDRTTEDAYAFIDRYIDVQEFINYLSAEIFYCNTDWPGNNIKFWRQRSTNGKFRWILWDTDFGFALYQNQSYATHQTLHFATDPDNNAWPNPAWSTLHLRLLLENPQFKAKFIRTLTTSLGTAFSPSRIVQTVNSFQNNLKTEMPFHRARWNQNINDWNWEVERLKSFASERNEFMQSYIGSFFGLSGNVRISVSTFPATGGSVELNGIQTQDVENAFYFRDLQFDAVAKPSPGYVFSHYIIGKRESTPITLIDKGGEWKYDDLGTGPALDWNAQSFDDSQWSSGNAELGYGEGDEVTTVGFGPNAANKFITTYFRKTFSIADTVGLSSLAGSVLFDDGLVIYLNGEEVYRSHLPAGAVTNTTLATSQESETSFFPFTIAKGKIKPGDNVLAVEVHQTNASSSDLSFNLELKTVRSGAETTYQVDDVNFSDVANSDVHIEAYFVPTSAVVSGLVINEVSVQNSENEDNYGEKDDWIEIYNNGTEAVDLTNLFVTDKLSNKLKYRIAAGKVGDNAVAPGSYKLIWADGDVNQGPLHTNFRLSTDGEAVGLYQKIGEDVLKLDEVLFGPQQQLTTLSRIPNVTGSFVETMMATPLAENLFEAVMTVEDEFVAGFQVYPNPSRSTFKVLFDGAKASYSIYNITGKMLSQKADASSGDEISIENHPNGIYLMVLSVNGKTHTKRLVIMK